MKKESPVEKFPGHVVLPDYMNAPQVRAFEDAYFGDPNAERPKKGERVYRTVQDAEMIPVFISAVQEWHIEGVPEKPSIETFPMTPQPAAHDLVV